MQCLTAQESNLDKMMLASKQGNDGNFVTKHLQPHTMTSGPVYDTPKRPVRTSSMSLTQILMDAQHVHAQIQ